jgi:hypothetical protein
MHCSTVTTGDLAILGTQTPNQTGIYPGNAARCH